MNMIVELLIVRICKCLKKLKKQPRGTFTIGNITQKVTVQDQTTTLIMGDNVDYGDSESGTIRNGVGKAQPLSAKNSCRKWLENYGRY